MAKNTNVVIHERTHHDVIEITLPNKSVIRITTSKAYNEIQVQHSADADEKMVIKPHMGNCFDIICTDVKY